MSDNALPPDFTDFPEEDRVRDGPMRSEILTMVLEALAKQEFPDITVASLTENATHRAAALDLLRDCRPMPVVLELIADIESGSFDGK